jgi:tetratricopeptide (TPR) repeat protein
MLALVNLAAATLPFAALAATPTSPTPPAAQQKAEEHYKRARELYSQGSYREALGELEAARALDPNAKELVFNLGVVNEKLGHFDDALRWFRTYTQMDVTAQEKQKADAFIKRLEGAKREVPPPTPTTTATTTPPPPPPPDKKDEPPPKGRIDAATITAASFAVAGLGLGTVFGIKALADRPKNYVTGKDGTIGDLQQKTNQANREATITDVSLGIGVVAAAVTAYLYFSRPKVVATTSPPASPQAHLSVVALPERRGGGVVMLEGSF